MVKFTFRFLKASFFLALALLGIVWNVVSTFISLLPDGSDQVFRRDVPWTPKNVNRTSDGRWIRY